MRVLVQVHRRGLSGQRDRLGFGLWVCDLPLVANRSRDVLDICGVLDPRGVNWLGPCAPTGSQTHEGRGSGGGEDVSNMLRDFAFDASPARWVVGGRGLGFRAELHVRLHLRW